MSSEISELTSLYSDWNSRARIHNASIRNSQLPLEALRTSENDLPPGFPATSAQLSTLLGMIGFQGNANRSY